MDDIQRLFKDTMAELMENGLEAELDDKLWVFSWHDYKNKDSSHNGHSNKTLRISFGDVEVSVLWNWKGEFFPPAAEEKSDQHQPGH